MQWRLKNSTKADKVNNKSPNWYAFARQLLHIDTLSFDDIVTTYNQIEFVHLGVQNAEMWIWRQVKSTLLCGSKFIRKPEDYNYRTGQSWETNYLALCFKAARFTHQNNSASMPCCWVATIQWMETDSKLQLIWILSKKVRHKPETFPCNAVWGVFWKRKSIRVT